MLWWFFDFFGFIHYFGFGFDFDFIVTILILVLLIFGIDGFIMVLAFRAGGQYK
jgi:hypothetical protein